MVLHVVVGVAAAAAIIVVGVGAYKVLNRDEIAKKIRIFLRKNGDRVAHKKDKNGYSWFAKVKKKIEAGEVYSVSEELRKAAWNEEQQSVSENCRIILDVRDLNGNVAYPDVVIEGDAFGEDVRIGSVIPIKV